MELRNGQAESGWDQMLHLKTEIAEALKEWRQAEMYFQYALGQDQVDYAIHAMITAEKRYEMLIHKAKEIKGEWPKWEEGAE